MTKTTLTLNMTRHAGNLYFIAKDQETEIARQHFQSRQRFPSPTCSNMVVRR